MGRSKARWLFLFFAGITLSVPAAFAQAGDDPPNLFGIEVGSNYYGQSLALSYSKKIIDHFWAGLSVEIGSLSLQSNAGSTILDFYNNSAYNYNIGLNIADLETLSLSYRLNEKGVLRFLNSLALGISYFDLTVNVSEQSASGALYQGQKGISAFALYTELHLLDFNPPGDQLAFSLGAKCNAAFLSSPQAVVTRNSAGNIIVVSEISPKGGSILFPYPELFLSVGRFF